MTETPPADSGTTTPPADSGTTTAPAQDTTPAPGDNQPTDPTQQAVVAQASGEESPELRSSSNITPTEVMKAAALPTPGTGSGGPITTVYGSKAPAVWATKGWAAAAGSKPNIGSGSARVVVEYETLNNTTLSANAEIVKNVETEDTWEAEGWTVATPPA